MSKKIEVERNDQRALFVIPGTEITNYTARVIEDGKVTGIGNGPDKETAKSNAVDDRNLKR